MTTSFRKSIGLIFFFFISIFSVSSQAYRVKNARELYDEKKYLEAHDELKIAKNHQRTVLYAETWAYDFLISDQILRTIEDPVSEIFWVEHLSKAYALIQEKDSLQEFMGRIQPLMDDLTLRYKQEAVAAFAQNRLDEFLLNQNAYLILAEAQGVKTAVQSYQFADLAKIQGDQNLAITYYRKSASLGFEAQLSVANWIALLQLQRLQDQADSVLALSLSRFPQSNFEGVVNALTAYDKGLYFTALKEVNEALLTAPNNPTLHYMTGIINLKTNRLDPAIEGFHKVEELIGASYLSNFQLGKYYLIDGKLNNDTGALSIARFYLEQCEQMEGDDIFLQSLLLDLYTVMGDQKNIDRINDLISPQ